MTSHAAVTALLQLLLMLSVVAAYVVAARRFPRLWHPLAIVLAVAVVGVAVSVAGVALFRPDATDVSDMLRRSLVGSVGWGLVIAAIVWIGRRLFVKSAR